MIYCQKCLHELQDGTLFCDVCGTSLLPETVVPSPSTRDSASAPPPLVGRDLTPATPPRAQPRPYVDGRASELRPAHTATSGRVRLRLTNGKTFELAGKSEYMIGRRDPQTNTLPDVDLADWNGAAAGVSRQHAYIYVEKDGVFIEDMESLNETIRNGYRLLPRQRYPLADGDEIRLGSITFLVVIS